MGDENTSETHPVKVSEATWKDLNALKDPGDTFDDVISELLDTEKQPAES